MNHPKPEEWVRFVYGETPRRERGGLKEHLEVCPECRGRVEQWRGSMNRLDRWKTGRPASKPMPLLAFPAVKWALAAGLMILAAFAFGRATTPRVDTRALRESITAELRTNLGQELAARMHETAVSARHDTEELLAAQDKTWEMQRGADFREVRNLIERFEAQRVSDLALLKRQLDTLAVNTDVSLRHTAENLVQLANYQASPAPEPTVTR